MTVDRLKELSNEVIARAASGGRMVVVVPRAELVHALAREIIDATNGASARPEYKPSRQRLTWPNGAAVELVPEHTERERTAGLSRETAFLRW